MMRRLAVVPAAIVIAMAVVVVPSPRPAAALTASEIRSRVQSLRADLKTLTTSVEAAEQRLASAEHAIRTHERALRNAERRRELLRETLRRQVAELYMLGSMTDVGMPGSVTDVPEYVDRLVYLERISGGEHGVLEELRALEANADTRSAALEEAYIVSRSTVSELTATRAHITSELHEMATLLAFIEPRLPGRATRGARGLYCPVAGPRIVSNNFGAPRPGGPHTGNDIMSDYGVPAVAVLPGVVVDTPVGGWIGIGVIMRDLAGNEWWYAHMGSKTVRIGQRVSPGEIVGRVGCTGRCYGPHLHFEYHPGGGGPVDPYGILSRAC